MSDFFMSAMSRERLSSPSLSGQGSVEWIIIVAIVGVALIGALALLSGTMGEKLNQVSDKINSVTV